MADSAKPRELLTRGDAEQRWRALIAKTLSRESASRWADAVIKSKIQPADPMVRSALYYIHGFDMTYRSKDQKMLGHGPPGEYVNTTEQIAEQLTIWLSKCAAYDADPDGYMSNARRVATEYIAAETAARNTNKMVD